MGGGIGELVLLEIGSINHTYPDGQMGLRMGFESVIKGSCTLAIVAVDNRGEGLLLSENVVGGSERNTSRKGFSECSKHVDLAFPESSR
ncbi:hypothetical protein MPNT_160003 [Candidatus Methylacidithermus pantelleriae]|uniref:Uncharacterized protein n=1 Tax=Candidatus Methylacidithermus pantelleriae TaxID=2744239 RepID=A0A8J2FVL1_9BACT|nr:hypothetical protein MPNT_160003 [Candidatus Methylacidithermus pantelleriae]